MVATATTILSPSISPRPNTLRTYIVLNTKSSRGRLLSFADVLEETSCSPPSDWSMSKKTSTTKQTGVHIPDECLAYESYAAVASRFQASTSTSPTRDLRWSDISRPRLHLGSLLSTSTSNNKNRKPLSQKARKRQLRRASNHGNPNDHLDVHALELCFEFLDLADLHHAIAVCTDFRDAITSSGRLVMDIYAQKWHLHISSPMAREYYTLGFQPALEMYKHRRTDLDYKPTTRSQVTKRHDATYEIVNNSLLRVLTHGAVDSVRGADALPVLSCARALGHRVSYFEVAMIGCGSVGVVSISDAVTCRAYGYGSHEHVGWKGVSFGYHGNDGDFVYNDGAAPYGGEWKPYGPSWGGKNTNEVADATTTTFTVGCGLNLTTRQLFFTLNGTFVGFAPVAVPQGDYAAAVSLHEFNDTAIMNAGSAPFRFNIEGFCASL